MMIVAISAGFLGTMRQQLSMSVAAASTATAAALAGKALLRLQLKTRRGGRSSSSNQIYCQPDVRLFRSVAPHHWLLLSSFFAH